MPKQCGIFFLALILHGGIFNGAKKRRHSVSIWPSFIAPCGSNGLIVMCCCVMGSAWLALWVALWVALVRRVGERMGGDGWRVGERGDRAILSAGASRAQPLPKIAGSGAWLSYAKHRSFAIVHKRVKPRHINVCIKSCINA